MNRTEQALKALSCVMKEYGIRIYGSLGDDAEIIIDDILVISSHKITSKIIDDLIL